MMIFGNPVAQRFIRPVGSPSQLGSFRVTQDFGPTSSTREGARTWPGGEGIPAGYYRHFHAAIDLGNGECGADVLAAQAGEVIAAGKDVDGAIRVIIRHGNGWRTWYWHLANERVTVGEMVEMGHVIGHVGNTGNSTACHLHFAVMQNGNPVDPWRRLAQNVTVRINQAGVYLRNTEGTATKPGEIFAKSAKDGHIHRVSDGADLGPFGQARKWGGTAVGTRWNVGDETGTTWERIYLDGAWRYAATALVTLSTSAT